MHEDAPNEPKLGQRSDTSNEPNEFQRLDNRGELAEREGMLAKARSRPRPGGRRGGTGKRHGRKGEVIGISCKDQNMSLTITIGRTEAGRFRAEVADHPRLVIEHGELSELVEDLKRNLDLIAVMPDGRLLLFQDETVSDTDEAAARAEVARTALSNERLDALIDRYPVPAAWGNEPGWSDVL
jgi:hypothetical protein